MIAQPQARQPIAVTRRHRPGYWILVGTDILVGMSINDAAGESPDRKAPVPQWAAEAFSRYLDWHEDAASMLHLSMRGISVLRAMPQALDALASVEDAEQPDTARVRRDIERANRDAEMATMEMDKGFPFLFSQAIVALWGSLEDLLRTFLVAWLANQQSAMAAEPIARLKVRLGDFLVGSDLEQYEYVLDRLSEELGATRMKGAERFECMLKPFGLSGAVPDDVGKALFELQQLRHVIVHRRGIADRRLLASCPWLGLSIGDAVTVSHWHYDDLSHAAAECVLEIIQRVREALGIGRLSADMVELLVTKRLSLQPEVGTDSPPPTDRPA